MKSLKKTLCMVFLCYLGKASALYLGNPSSSELPKLGILIPEERAVNFKLGYQVEKVFDRKMVLKAPELIMEGNQISSLSNQGVFTLSIIDRVEVFSTFGTMNVSVKQAKFQELEIKAHSKSSFVWSIGGRTLLFFWGNTSLGAEMSYLFSHSHLQDLGLNKIKQRVSKDALNYAEWQIQLALSQKVSVASLYLGGAYSYAQLKMNIPWYPIYAVYKNKHKISMVLGSSISARRGLTVNLEAKLFGETSLGANLDLRF